jgi:hypothetical protein
MMLPTTTTCTLLFIFTAISFDLILHPIFPSYLLSHPDPSLHLSPSIFLFLTFLCEIQATSLGPCFLFSFFGISEYNMAILYFVVNIHLQVSIYHACPFGSGLPHYEQSPIPGTLNDTLLCLQTGVEHGCPLSWLHLAADWDGCRHLHPNIRWSSNFGVCSGT